MGIPKIQENERFNYARYRTWPEGERWELIDGEAYAMSPAPNRRHQDVISSLGLELLNFFKGKPCKVYFSPFDVVLPRAGQSDDESENVVQPDLLVICDPKKLTDAGCTGAPDFTVEILSPSTSFKDMDQKLRLYERTGVQEYWIVNPANKTLMVYRQRTSGTFGKPELYSQDDVVEAGIFPGLKVSLPEIFAP